MKTYYMHTLDDKPAAFDGEQVCYMNYFGKPNPLCSSLRELRRQQRQSAEYRQRAGFKAGAQYGYRRVCVPD